MIDATLDVNTLFAGAISIVVLISSVFTTLQGRRQAQALREAAVRDQRHLDLDREFRAALTSLPHTYVLKEDYRIDMAEVKSLLKEIREKVNHVG